MAYLCFCLDSIPDLSLSKYSSLDESGVDGVLKKTAGFLRQINRKGILSKVWFHLLYLYDPDGPKGNRLKVRFIASGEGEALKHTCELVQNSAISAFYNLRSMEQMADIEKDDKGKTYAYAAALGKREFFIEPSVVLPEDGNLKYYKVSKWEMNEDARLYNMFRLMQGFQKPVAFRVDLFSVDYAAGLRNVLPIQELRNRTSIQLTKNAAALSMSRDENAEEALRQYSELIETYECSPHFRTNILAFSDEEEIAKLVADAAGAEALEAGSYSIKTFKAKAEDLDKEKFNVFSFMEKPVDIEGIDAPKQLKFMPNLFLLEEIRPFFTFPALHDGETIEIPKETAPNVIDSEEKTDKGQKLKLGTDEHGYDVDLPIELLKKHAFLAGVPGSGKTNSMLHLATSLWKNHHIPFLILEPAKKEYRVLARIEGMDELLIFSPSSGTRFPLHINPFEFPCGMSLSEHIRNLMAVFEGAFTLAAPAPFMIDNAIEAVYRKKGWYPDTINESKLPYPTMAELYEKLAEEVEKTEYEGDIKGNLKSILQVRIGSLLRREMGDVFDVPESSLRPEDWLEVPALIELEAMGSGPANFLTLLLSTLIRESLKVIPSAEKKNKKKGLRHILFFEEAHNLIGPVASEVTGEDADPKLAATAYVVKMLAEVRALNEGIIIADQLPTVMAPEVIKNTGLKIGHRLTAEDDRNLLGTTMSANPTQLEQMATFIPGEALVTFEGLLRPFKARIAKWQDDDSLYESPSNEELAGIMTGKSGYNKLLEASSTIFCEKFSRKHNELEREIQTFSDDSNKFTLDLHEFEKFLGENDIPKNWDTKNDNPLVVKAQERGFSISNTTKSFRSRHKKIAETMHELFVMEKGYLFQNRPHEEATKHLLVQLNTLRTQLGSVVAQCKDPRLKMSYDNFSQKLNPLEIEKILGDAVPIPQ